VRALAKISNLSCRVRFSEARHSATGRLRSRRQGRRTAHGINDLPGRRSAPMPLGSGSVRTSERARREKEFQSPRRRRSAAGNRYIENLTRETARSAHRGPSWDPRGAPHGGGRSRAPRPTEGRDGLLRQLEVHYLSDPDPSLVFVLLVDHVDSKARPDAAALLAYAEERVVALNAAHAGDGPGPFLLLYREPRWNAAEACFMG
jgi:hypothetical protein